MPSDAWRAYENLHVRGGNAQLRCDGVAVEEPLELRIGKLAIAVVMRTPGHDEELAAGFLFTEGLIAAPDDLIELSRCPDGLVAARDNVLIAQVREDARIDLARMQRHFYATSSCGVCGKASIDLVRQSHAPVADEIVVARSTLLTLPDVLRSRQSLFNETGGVHAAGLFDRDGRCLCVREDVGRHNAVDKVIGWALRDGRLPLAGTVLQVSGRASFEIVQKALAARIPIVSAVSAPSSLAVDLARESNVTLACFVRPGGFAAFSSEQRLL